MKTFKLRVLTPERAFYTGDASGVTVESIAGRLSVLPGHTPMVTALTAGMLRLQDAEGEHVAFHSLGYMEVSPQEVSILCQACEWPREIDAARAREAELRARGRLSEGTDNVGRSKVALLRAMARLRTHEYSGEMHN